MLSLDLKHVVRTDGLFPRLGAALDPALCSRSLVPPLAFLFCDIDRGRRAFWTTLNVLHFLLHLGHAKSGSLCARLMYNHSNLATFPPSPVRAAH